MTERNTRSCSVIVPVYNGQENLSLLVERLLGTLSGYARFEIILVNDGSRDNSWQVIKQISGAHPEVKGFDLRKNSGQDNALMAGLRQVTGEYVVIMDDDLQHAPEDIPRLTAQLEATDADVCFAHFDEKKQARWKKLGSWVNGKLAEWVVEKPAGTYLSPFKAIRLDLVREMVRYEGPFPYVDGLIFTLTNRVSEISVAHHERKVGTSNYTFFKSAQVLMKLATSFSVLPLRLASILGVCMAFFGFCLAIYYVGESVFGGRRVEGWLSNVVLCISLNGVILLALGMIGEYLGRAYLNINKRPQYSIRSSTKETP